MNNGSTPLIHLDNVTKVFLTDEVETHALSGIHLDIRPGEYISIAGPSGCGKSTLLSILGLLDTPSDGSYSLKGHEVANLSFPDRARIRNREIGFIFQSFNLIGDLTVYENVELPLTYRGMAAQERNKFVTEALDDFGYALRLVLKSPAFSAVAILTLALGIGANTAIFSVVEGTLLRPLPFPEADRLVRVYEAADDLGARGSTLALTEQTWRQ